MATITPFPVVRHLRATPTTHVIHLAGGKPRHRGVGAAFWFRALTAVISEVPVDDRERAVLVTHRTADLQQLAVPGVVSYRVADPELAATRVDFSIDLQRGQWTQTPLESIGAAVHGATAEAVASALAGHDLRAALALDLAALGADVHARLAADPGLASLGLAVVGVRFGVLRPEPDVERAIQTPAREALQQAADTATFARRAKAVEREAAIGENELANKIELARRRENSSLRTAPTPGGRRRSAPPPTRSPSTRTPPGSAPSPPPAPTPSGSPGRRAPTASAPGSPRLPRSPANSCSPSPCAKPPRNCPASTTSKNSSPVCRASFSAADSPVAFRYSSRPSRTLIVVWKDERRDPLARSQFQPPSGWRSPSRRVTMPVTSAPK